MEIISKNVKIIDNLFISELYRNYILSLKNNKNKKTKSKSKINFKMTFLNPQQKKIFEKLILNNVIKNIPKNLSKVFNQYELKKYYEQLIRKKQNQLKINNSYSSQKNNKKIFIRNNSSTQRFNKLKLFKIKPGNKNTEPNREKNFIQKNICHKNYVLPKRTRNNSEYLYNHMNIDDNKNLNEKNNASNNLNKSLKVMSTKNNKYLKFLLRNYNLLLDNLTENEEKKVKNIFVNKINKENNNNKFYKIYDYKYNIKPFNKKLILDISNSNEKTERKNYSKKILLNNVSNYGSNNLFNLPKKKVKTELLLNSDSPEEIFITSKTSNILNNLKQIKKGIKIGKNTVNKNKNIKFMRNMIENEQSLDFKFIKSEIKNTNNYEYFLNNRNQIERQKSAFKILRNTFNISERSPIYKKQYSFIKTLNNFCKEEKELGVMINQIYKDNYWLRLNNNRKYAKNLKLRIDKMNKRHFEVNYLFEKINRLNYNIE